MTYFAREHETDGTILVPIAAMVVVNVRRTAIVAVATEETVTVPVVVRSHVLTQTHLFKTTRHPDVILRQAHRKYFDSLQATHA